MDNNSPCYFRNSFVAPPFYPRYGEKWTLDSHTNIYPMHDVKTAINECAELCVHSKYFSSAVPGATGGWREKRSPFHTRSLAFEIVIYSARAHFLPLWTPGGKGSPPKTGKTAAGKFSETDSLWSFVAIIGQVTWHGCFFVDGFHYCPARHNDYRINDRVDCSFFAFALLFHSNF